MFWIMSLAKASLILVFAACLGLAGCAATPTEGRARIADMPLAATHADIAFTLTTGSRQSSICEGSTNCQTKLGRATAKSFTWQVQRITAALQDGAQYLYPDLAKRVPGLNGSRFDVYVTEGDEPRSASSANGRIALNAALGAGQPYDDWLAFIIAREMGHVIARHHEENSATSMAASVIINLIVPGSALLKSAISAGGAGVVARSKQDEQALEADLIALSLLKAAGFRLRDVSLSLLIMPALPDGDPWSNSFRKSADVLLARANTL
jgi:Zn-dependent protease with chaperone function